MSLRASEAVIYGRYGFGMAGEYVEAAIDAARARPVAGQAAGGHVRLLPPDEIHDTIHDVYDRAVHRRPGMLTRPDSWWQRYFRDAVSGAKNSYVVVHVDGHGVVDGYAHYDVAWNDDGAPGGKGEVQDVIGIDDAVELALWGYLLDIDLVRSWKADERPVDDIVRAAIADRRAYSVKCVDDEQWLRVIDVDAALSARTYNAAAGEVSIGVTDPLVDRNNGTWRVSAAGAERTSDSPDLAVDIATLSATYLGGTAWQLLAAVGDVEVRSPAAPATADTLFASHLLPVLRQLLLTDSPGPGSARAPAPGPVGLAGCDHAQLIRRDHCVDPAAHVELQQHAGDVRLDRRLADHQIGGDLCVAHPAGDAFEHLALAAGQCLELGRLTARRRSALDVGVDQPARHVGSEQRVAGRHRSHRRRQIVATDVLQQESAGAGAQRFVDVLVEIEGRHDQHTHGVVTGEHSPGRLEAVEARHPNVHQHHVRLLGIDELQRFEPVGGLADDDDVGLRGQDRLKSGANDGLVVDDRDPDHDTAPVGIRASSRNPPADGRRRRASHRAT